MKEFLRFEKDKLILPIILIAIMAVTLVNSYQAGEVYDSGMCQFSEAVKKAMIYNQSNESEKYQKALWDLRSFDNLQQGMREVRKLEFLHKILKDMNPLQPVSCEVRQYNYPLYDCRHFMKQETHDCIKQNQAEFSFVSDYSLKDSEYKQISSFDIIISVIILSAEGYLISCAIIYIYRKINIKNIPKKKRRRKR